MKNRARVGVTKATALLLSLVPVSLSLDLNQGPGGPILVITSSSFRYGTYYAEILRTEGLNEFTVADIATLNQPVPSTYDVVILAPAALTAAQVTNLSAWVNGGGNLIAMKPDPQLASLVGVTSTGPTPSKGYRN